VPLSFLLDFARHVLWVCHELVRATGCEQGSNDPKAWKREDRATIELTLDRGVGGSRNRTKQGSEDEDAVILEG